ncbi:MAG: DUF4359 domain-containing protein [Cyanobacteria bacterium P01_A01_bin.15]
MSSSTSTQSISVEVQKSNKQPPIKLVGGCLVLLGTLLAVTNPGKPAYYEYVTNRFMEPLENSKKSCEELEQEIGLGLAELPSQDLCKFALGGVTGMIRPLAKETLKRATKHRNLGIFSLHTTELPGKKVTSIGIARQFITFSNQ